MMFLYPILNTYTGLHNIYYTKLSIRKLIYPPSSTKYAQRLLVTLSA